MILARTDGIAQVSMAVLKKLDGTHVRYFSSSQEVIKYLLLHPGQDFLLEPAAIPLTHLEQESGEYGPQYGDVFMGQIKFDPESNQVICV